MHDIRLRRAAVADVGDIVDINRGAIDRLDRQVAQRFERERRVVQLQRVFVIADFFRTDWRQQVLRGERIGDVLGRQAACLQCSWVDVDLYLARLAPKRIGDRRTGHRHQRRTQLVQSKVTEVLFGETFARQGELDDRYRRRVVVQDQRRRGARRQLTQLRLRDGGHLGVRVTDVHARLEEDLDDAEAINRFSFYVLDVVHRRGQRTLERRRDSSNHLIRRQARVLPYDADHGNADIGKDVGRRSDRGKRSDDQDEDRQDDKRIWPSESDTY